MFKIYYESKYIDNNISPNLFKRHGKNGLNHVYESLEYYSEGKAKRIIKSLSSNTTIDAITYL